MPPLLPIVPVFDRVKLKLCPPQLLRAVDLLCPRQPASAVPSHPRNARDRTQRIAAAVASEAFARCVASVRWSADGSCLAA